MLESIDVFEVVLIQSVAFEYSTQESQLITTDREQAMDFANSFVDNLDINDFEYIDCISVEVRGGVLGKTGIDEVLFIQRVSLYDEREAEDAALISALRQETTHDEMMESIMRDAEKTRKVISGFSGIPLNDGESLISGGS